MFAPKCGGCNRAIMENYISALNSQWHPDCFVCRVGVVRKIHGLIIGICFQQPEIINALFSRVLRESPAGMLNCDNCRIARSPFPESPSTRWRDNRCAPSASVWMMMKKRRHKEAAALFYRSSSCRFLMSKSLYESLCVVVLTVYTTPHDAIALYARSAPLMRSQPLAPVSYIPIDNLADAEKQTEREMLSSSSSFRFRIAPMHLSFTHTRTHANTRI